MEIEITKAVHLIGLPLHLRINVKEFIIKNPEANPYEIISLFALNDKMEKDLEDLIWGFKANGMNHAIGGTATGPAFQLNRNI